MTREAYKAAHIVFQEAFKKEEVWRGKAIDDNQDNVIISFWFASINIVSGVNVLVAVVNTTQGKKGIICVPDLTERHHPRPATPTRKLVTLDVSDWIDPVAEALHDVDGLPAHDGYVHFDGPGPCDLIVDTDSSTMQIIFEGWTKNPKLSRLWGAVRDTVYNFTEMSNDEQIIHYLDTAYYIPLYSSYLNRKYGKKEEHPRTRMITINPINLR